MLQTLELNLFGEVGVSVDHVYLDECMRSPVDQHKWARYIALPEEVDSSIFNVSSDFRYFIIEVFPQSASH